MFDDNGQFHDQANPSRGSDNTDTDNATGSDFVPKEKTSSPDLDDEFPSSLAIPRLAHPCPSSCGKMLPTKSPSKSAHHAKSPSAAVLSRAATPDNSVMLYFEERQLPKWVAPEHIPDFTIHYNPSIACPDWHTSYQPLSDIEIMESFKDMSLVECHLEDSPPEVFSNPVYLISNREKWLQKLADGDHFVEGYCCVYNGHAHPNDPYYDHPKPKPEPKPFVARVLKVSEPGNECTLFAEYQEATARNTKICQQHKADETARFRELAAENAAMLKKWETRAVEYRRQLPIVGARQVETGTRGGEYMYHLASRALPLSGRRRVGLSHISAAPSTLAPSAALPSNSAPANFDDVPTPPIAVFAEGDSGSGKDHPSEVTRVGPPGKGKTKAAASKVDPEFCEGRAATPSSRVVPGTALSVRLEASKAGPTLAGGSDETPYDHEAWHTAHNPFDKPLFQTEVVLNMNGTKAVISHGWRVDMVSPCFLARLALYGIIGTQVPAIVVVTRATGCNECHETQTGCVHIQNAGTPLVTSCQRCCMKNHTCGPFKGSFDFTLTDHVIFVVNTELLDIYTDSLLVAFSSFTGINVASCLIARSIVFRQDSLLQGRCASHTDAPAAEEPIECRVDVLLREGRGRESYIEHSLVPFWGAQFGDHKHQLPLPPMQDANDTMMFLTHIFEDLIDCISIGAHGMGGSFNQHITQAFHPDWCVHLPENFEVGDRSLVRDSFVAPEAVRVPPSRPPILPADGELSGFPSSYHFGDNVRAQLEEQYLGGVVVKHADGRITGPVAAGGFDVLEDAPPRGEASSSGSRCASAHGSLLPIDEETRATTPPSSTAFTSVPSTPSNSSQLSLARVGSAGSFSGPWFTAAMFDTTPTPLHSGSALVGSSVSHLSALEMTLLTPSTAQRFGTHGMSLPPRIVVDTHIARTSSPGCTASVNAGKKGYFSGLETGNAGDANGASGGSMDSECAAVGSLVGLGGEDVDME
ncbi:hypothetical protein DFH08DRAFT_964572 [Mycena albidolilacea]|uniref:Uncharacterized protein n=1 Tax=Mycena albidolilacea TaxID=1033008 RepID=A0AAD6ZU49_9AGAR|nr:hypothetical protein DFH08DRAFT_964572 [Mycena albidolilacea]